MHNLFDLSVELQSQGSIYHFMEIQSFPTANETFSCQLTFKQFLMLNAFSNSYTFAEAPKAHVNDSTELWLKPHPFILISPSAQEESLI